MSDSMSYWVLPPTHHKCSSSPACPKVNSLPARPSSVLPVSITSTSLGRSLAYTWESTQLSCRCFFLISPRPLHFYTCQLPKISLEPDNFFFLLVASGSDHHSLSLLINGCSLFTDPHAFILDSFKLVSTGLPELHFVNEKLTPMLSYLKHFNDFQQL